MIRGQFVVVFPFHGGWSVPRIKRVAYQRLLETAMEAGVTVTGELSYRLDRTAKGLFVVAEAPGVTERDAGAVRADAEHMAYAHRVACPHLSQWIDQYTPEAAA